MQELLQQGFLSGTCTCNLVQDTGAGTKAAYNRCRLVSALVQLRRRRPCCNETCTDICNGGQQPLPPVNHGLLFLVEYLALCQCSVLFGSLMAAALTAPPTLIVSLYNEQ